MIRALNTTSTAAAKVLAAVLAGACTLAGAQALDPNTIMSAGLQTAQMIDAGKAADIWDGASPVTRKKIGRQQFLQAVDAARRPLGQVRDRSWLSVTRNTTSGTPDLPPGNYVNVEYLTTFATGKVGKELVSFRLDEDGQWRVIGYALR